MEIVAVIFQIGVICLAVALLSVPWLLPIGRGSFVYSIFKEVHKYLSKYLGKATFPLICWVVFIWLGAMYVVFGTMTTRVGAGSIIFGNIPNILGNRIGNYMLKVGGPFFCGEGYQDLVVRYGKSMISTASFCTGEMGEYTPPWLVYYGILTGVFWLLVTVLFVILFFTDKALRWKNTKLRYTARILVTVGFWTFFVMTPDVLRPVARPISDYVAKSRYGPLYDAVKRSNIKMTRLLLERGVDPNIKSLSGNAPLTAAVYKNNIEITRLLLKNGADPNRRDRLGSTPFLRAVAEGKTGIIKVLVKSGADVNLRNKSGKTALMKAANRGTVYSSNVAELDTFDVAESKDIIALLVRNGADLTARDKDGKSVLDWAVDSSIRRLLLQLGAGSGEPPEKVKVWEKGMGVSLHELVYGIRRNDLEIVKLLLKAGLDISKNESVPRGSTPLIEAVIKRSPWIVEILLNNGADANAHSYYSDVIPLLKAAEERSPRIVEILLNNGADVNAYDVRGNSALIIAAKKGTTDTVKLLLDNGADVNHRDNEDNTVLTYAKKGKDKKIVELLERAGATE